MMHGFNAGGMKPGQRFFNHELGITIRAAGLSELKAGEEIVDRAKYTPDKPAWCKVESIKRDWGTVHLTLRDEDGQEKKASFRLSQKGLIFLVREGKN